VRVRRFPAWLFIILLLAVPALAARIEIDTNQDPDSRLEIRNVELPDGSRVQLYVITGNPVRVLIDEDELVGNHIEFDLTNRIIRVIGFGSFKSANENIQGDDLIIDLEQEAFTGNDVLIITDAIDVLGVEASRVPGQINVIDGSFSPCSRCLKDVEDFGFRAKRLLLFPGDRLVAYDVTVLIREYPLFDLPLMVVPLGPPDRTPKLSIIQGTAEERASISLDWPYVAGRNALGSFSVRYFADITPDAGGFLLNQLLGGRVDTSYLGGSIEHRFFTETGSGTLAVSFQPSFLDPNEPDGRTDSLYTVRAEFETDEELDVPQVDLALERDDANRNRIFEYRLALGNTRQGLTGKYLTQGFIDLDPQDSVKDPSFANRITPRRTLSQLTFQAADNPALSVGTFSVGSVMLDLGIFEDVSNPTNRSAAGTPFFNAGRLLEAHTLQLTPTPLWQGFQVSGQTTFQGKYYTTGERLIDWNTSLTTEQRLLDIGSLNLTFTRNTGEGETPFRFDQIPLRSRTDLRSSLQLQPLDWLALSVQETLVIEDTRSPQVEGLNPLESRLTLFGNLDFLDATISNRYDIKTGDPGTLDASLALRSPDPSITANLEVTYVQDLKATADRLSGAILDDSKTMINAGFGIAPYLTADLKGGYTFAPPFPEEPSEPRDFWQPLELGVTLGTLEQDDGIPGLRVSYTRDLNRGKLDNLTYQASIKLGPLEVGAQQAFDVRNGRLQDSSYQISWPGVAALEGHGFSLIPPAWLGLDIDPNARETWTVTLRDAPLEGQEAWRLSYQTTKNPTLDLGNTVGGFENSSLEARVILEDTRLGPTHFSVDFFADLKIGDDSISTTYLRRGNLALQADIASRVGIQGTLGYSGFFDPVSEEVTRAALSIKDFAVTVRVLDELFLGAIFNDVWDFTGNNPNESPFNFQPTVLLVWDRCCWALHAQWNSETGQIKLAITTPGSNEGLIQSFDTPLVLPGRQ